ncbi:unnamed protein product, partial [Polarella glacialis]
LLRSQVSEMRRLDAGVADNSGSRPRPSSITIRGQAPPRLPEADDGSRRAQVQDEEELQRSSRRVLELSVELGLERRRRVEQAEELRDAEARERA